MDIVLVNCHSELTREFISHCQVSYNCLNSFTVHVKIVLASIVTYTHKKPIMLQVKHSRYAELQCSSAMQ